MVAKEFWKGDSVSFSFFLLCPTLTLTHYFTYHSFSILVRPVRAVTHIESILGTGDERHAFVKMGNCPSFILNEANLTREQIARLTHWRQAHRQCGEGEIHENCPVCQEGKRKTKGFKKNDVYRDEVTSNCQIPDTVRGYIRYKV